MEKRWNYKFCKPRNTRKKNILRREQACLFPTMTSCFFMQLCANQRLIFLFLGQIPFTIF